MKQYGYHVKINSYCDYEEHSDEPYGYWTELYTNTLDHKVKKCDPEKMDYPDMSCPFDFKKGDAAFIVWLEYSSGDSFGHGEKNCTMLMGMFRDLESAADLEEKILHLGKKNGDYSYKFKTPDGQVFTQGFASWLGYFESLDEVHVDLVSIA